MADWLKGREGSFSGQTKWITLFGERILIDNIQRLTTKGQRTILRKSMAKGAKIVEKRAKQLAPVGKGHLRASIKSKVTRLITGRVYVDPNYIAAKTKDSQEYVVKLRGKTVARNRALRASYLRYAKREGHKLIIPVKYAHFVEFGTRKSKAHPFMRRAVDETKEQVVSVIYDEFNKGFAEYQKKYGK